MISNSNESYLVKELKRQLIDSDREKVILKNELLFLKKELKFKDKIIKELNTKC